MEKYDAGGTNSLEFRVTLFLPEAIYSSHVTQAGRNRVKVLT